MGNYLGFTNTITECNKRVGTITTSDTSFYNWRLIDLSDYIDCWWKQYVVKWFEYTLWNYGMKYVALGFCDYEATKNTTTECWGLAWVFRPTYLMTMTVTLLTTVWTIIGTWIITKWFVEITGIYAGIIEVIDEDNE